MESHGNRGCGCAGGEQTTTRDERGRRKRYTKDVLGRLASVEELNWDQSVYATTTNTFNARGQVKLVRQFQGTAPADPNDLSCPSGTCQQTAMTYDGYGRLLTRHVPEQDAGTATVYAYNSDDTVQTVTDARGATCTYGYNNRHQVTSATHVLSGQPTIALSYGYDAAGNRTSMTDAQGSTSFSYDSLSRMTSETRSFSGLGSYSINYQYNLANDLSSITNPQGPTISYNHDQTGRLSSVTGSLFSGITSYASNLQYRAWGAVRHVSYGSGAELNVTYNGRLLPTRYELGNVSTSGTSITTMGTANQFYDDGRVRYAQDLQNGNFDRGYEYDQVGRIQHATSGREARGLAPVFPRDNPFHQSYTYDVWSNMARPTNQHWSAALPPDTPTYTNNRRADWSYDANGEVTSRDGETKLQSYDAMGKETHYWEYVFHPEEPWLAETNTIDQNYDGDGRRLKRIESRQEESAQGTSTTTETTYYLTSTVLGGVTVAEIGSYGEVKKGWVYAGGQKLAEFSGSGYTTWRHVNPATGSWLTSAVSGAGGYVVRNELDPLGTDMGTSDPYVTFTTYSDIMGLQSLYEERGNPFDPGGGCGTLDGLPISCSELRVRMQGGSVATESLVADMETPLDQRVPGEAPRRIPSQHILRTVFGEIRDLGVGLFGFALPMVGYDNEGVSWTTGAEIRHFNHPQKPAAGSFLDCFHKSGLATTRVKGQSGDAMLFTKEAADLLLDIHNAEGTSLALLAVTQMNENTSFDLRPAPTVNFDKNGRELSPDWWDVGPFGLNPHYISSAIERGVIKNEGKNYLDFGLIYGRTAKKGQPFTGSPLANGRIAARWLTVAGGTDRQRAINYAGREGRGASYDSFAPLFNRFFDCYRR